MAASTPGPTLSGGASGPDVGGGGPGAGPIADFWWLRLAVGIAWCVASLVMLQFDDASVTTVGVIVGIMFLVLGAQELALTMLGERARWYGYVFGTVFLAAGVLALLNPEDTFAGVADILGFLFLVVGIAWTIEAFAARERDALWWVGLIAAVFMLGIAFWTAGQFFIEKAYVLLVFAGGWALMQGILEIVRAFGLRAAR